MKAIDDLPHDYTQCLHLTSLVVFAYTASQISLVMLTVDRFWAICFPVQYHNRKNETLPLLILSSWSVPLVFWLLPLTGWNGKDVYEGRCIATAILDSRLLTLSTVALYVICIAMILMYTAVYMAIARQVISKKNHEHIFFFTIHDFAEKNSSEIVNRRSRR